MSAESFALTMDLQEGYRARVLYCLQRARVEVQALRTSVSGSLDRTDAGRQSIRQGIEVDVAVAPISASSAS